MAGLVYDVMWHIQYNFNLPAFIYPQIVDYLGTQISIVACANPPTVRV